MWGKYKFRNRVCDSCRVVHSSDLPVGRVNIVGVFRGQVMNRSCECGDYFALILFVCLYIGLGLLINLSGLRYRRECDRPIYDFLKRFRSSLNHVNSSSE